MKDLSKIKRRTNFSATTDPVQCNRMFVSLKKGIKVSAKSINSLIASLKIFMALKSVSATLNVTFVLETYEGCRRG